MDRQENELALVLIKPDALKLSLTGYILSQFSEFHAGLRFAGAKIVRVSELLAEEHYVEHKGKPFYPSLIEYITGQVHYRLEPEKRRVVALVYCGRSAVEQTRKIAGMTNPHAARDETPGTIRALGTVVPVRDETGRQVGDRMDNLVHASASPTEAEREIKLWFLPKDIVPSMRPYATERCREHYYLASGKVSTTQAPGSRCFLAPGNLAWKSDMEALRCLSQGEPAACSIDAVVVKYLINEDNS